MIKFLCLAILTIVSGASSAKGASANTKSSPIKSPHHYMYVGRDRALISQVGFLSTSRLEGAQIMYSWKQLEHDEGVYEFSDIQHDLNYLKSKDKKLFIQIQDATFDPAKAAVPNYIMKDPKYNGGVIWQYDSQGKPEGTVAMRWHPEVRRRFKKLLEALGRQFDDKIEGLNLQETSIGVVENPTNAAKGFSYEGYRNAILENMTSLKQAFPTSTTMQYLNFMPGEWLPDDDKSYMRSIFEYAARIGAPDLMPDKLSQKNHVYKFMSGRHWTIPLGIAVQDGNYVGETGDDRKPTASWPNIVPHLDQFATTTLKVKYIFWGAQEPYFSHDVIPYLKRK